MIELKKKYKVAIICAALVFAFMALNADVDTEPNVADKLNDNPAVHDPGYEQPSVPSIITIVFFMAGVNLLVWSIVGKYKRSQRYEYNPDDDECRHFDDLSSNGRFSGKSFGSGGGFSDRYGNGGRGWRL